MEEQVAPNEAVLDESFLTRLLAITAVVLVTISIAGRIAYHVFGITRLHGFIPLFDVDCEQNVPTVFSMMLLVFAAQLLGCIAFLERRLAGRSAWRWWVLTAGFLFMAVDEVASLHEKLIEPVRALLGTGASGILYYAWVIPFGALVLMLAPFLIGFVLRLPPKTRRYLIVAGVLYVGGALGMELLGGAYAKAYGTMNIWYAFITVTEESLEMAGVITLIHGLLAYVTSQHGEVLLRFAGSEPAVSTLLP